MIELIFVACLATSPIDCRKHSLLFTDTSLFQCVLHAQTELAKWCETNIGWGIEKWSCKLHKHYEVKV